MLHHTDHSNYQSVFTMPFVYINLDHRTDRKAEMERELQAIGFDMARVHRLSATARPDGAEGCTESQIRAQEWGMQQPTPFVFFAEDDLSFPHPTLVLQRVHEALQRPYLNVLLLGTNAGSYSATEVPGLFKARHSQTASGYIVRTSYLPTLMQHFQSSLALYRQSRSKPAHACDMYWKSLQEDQTWFALLEPRLAVQRPSFSDIERCHVNYGV